MKKFLLTTWDGDIYILTGYETVEEIRERMGNLDWVTMPNGAEIKQSAISKIQPIEDYRFQVDQKQRHKRGQYLGGGNQDKWYEAIGGEVGRAKVESITGGIKNLPAAGKPTGKRLTD